MKECNVCFEEIDTTNKKILPCDHVFCKNCLNIWNKGTCPTCRNRFRPDNEDTIIEEYINIRLQWLDSSLTRSIYNAFNLSKSTLECKLKLYSGDHDIIEKEEILESVLEKMKNKLAILFCRIVNGRNIIKELKTVEMIQKKSHKIYLEFMNGMNIILIEGEKELDNELNDYFYGTPEQKLKKKENFKNETSGDPKISIFFI